MPWTLRFHPAIKKDLRRLSNERRNFILHEALLSLSQDPYRGEPLHGPLRGLRRYTIGDERIAYNVDEKSQEILVLHVGLRGGFYERLRRRARR